MSNANYDDLNDLGQGNIVQGSQNKIITVVNEWQVSKGKKMPPLAICAAFSQASFP